MLAAIQFNDQLWGECREINYIILNRLLATKLNPFNLAVPETLPESNFGVCAVVAKIMGPAMQGMSWFHCNFPHPLTPSRQGRGNLTPNPKCPKFTWLGRSGGEWRHAQGYEWAASLPWQLVVQLPLPGPVETYTGVGTAPLTV